MKLKMSDVDKMIKEEFQKMIGKKKLTSRLSQINEELSKMESEDSDLNEVEASGMQKTKSATGLVPGEQHGVKFEKIGTHLKEEEEEEEEEVVVDDMGADDMVGDDMGAGIEMGTEVSEEPAMGEFEAKFAELGRVLDAKLAAEGGAGVAAEIGAEMGAEDNASDDDFEEVEVAPEMGETPAEEETEEEEEIDEYKEVVGGEGQAQGMTAGEVKESVEEPLEGHSVVQDATADTVNDNMEKDTHVKESAAKKGAVISEAKAPAAKNIFTEGVDPKKKAALLEEMNRMKRFAGLSKDEE